MTINSISTYLPRLGNLEKTPESGVIDLDSMKAILYLGIKGEISLPLDGQHAIDTFA